MAIINILSEPDNTLLIIRVLIEFREMLFLPKITISRLQTSNEM